MKIRLALIVLCFMLIGSAFAQDSIEKIVKDIRKKYQLINQKKFEYDVKEEEYNWEQDELVPKLTEEQLEHEYNEEGNYTSRKKTYYNKNKVIQLIEIDDEIQRYQENNTMRKHREYYFWQNKLFFYFEQNEEIIGFESEKASEKRMYFYNEKLIRYLTKEIEDQGIEALSNTNNEEQDIDDLETLKWEDLIDSYNDLLDWK
jgi:hypothetical protein